MKVEFNQMLNVDTMLAKVGDVRADGDGRVILVVALDVFEDARYNGDTYKAVVLREADNGDCDDFWTVPANYTLREITEYYPYKLDAALNVYGVVPGL